MKEVGGGGGREGGEKAGKDVGGVGVGGAAVKDKKGERVEREEESK